jgi:endonuclease YncB( thermonuclease family)
MLMLGGAVLAEDGGEIVPAPSRDVTPPGATRLPEGTGPLTREPFPPPPPEPARWRRFFLPATVDAATFRADRLTIRISGLSAPPAAGVCPTPGGQTWPCGRTALTSFRQFLRGRAVECYFPRPDGVEEVIAPCRVGKIDLGTWLLAQGWAKPDGNATDDYRAAARAAACAGRGLWRSTPPSGDCAAPAN